MIKRGRIRLNKNGQFFIIFAVVFGAILLIAISQVNLVEKKTGSFKIFQTRCENYKNEIFKISEYAVNTGQKEKEFEFINDFTIRFIDFMNKSYDFEMFYLYGDSSKINVTNYFNKEIIANTQKINSENSIILSGSLINIKSGNFVKSYVFKEDDVFYFYMKAEKEREIYICE